MKEIELEQEGNFITYGAMATRIDGGVAQQLGITGPGILRYEFVPEQQWPEEPDCDDWREHWFVDGKYRIKYLMDSDMELPRKICGLSAAGWCLKHHLKYSGEYGAKFHNIAQQWLKWSEGKEWR